MNIFKRDEHHHIVDRELLYIIAERQDFLFIQIQRLVMTNEELAQGLVDLNTQLGKVNTEITGKIADLESAINNSDSVPQTVVDAFNALKPAVQALDDIVPDAPPAEPGA